MSQPRARSLIFDILGDCVRVGAREIRLKTLVRLGEMGGDRGLAQVHLAPAQAAGATKLVVEPLEANHLVGEVLRLLAVRERLLDR